MTNPSKQIQNTNTRQMPTMQLGDSLRSVTLSNSILYLEMRSWDRIVRHGEGGKVRRKNRFHSNHYLQHLRAQKMVTVENSIIVQKCIKMHSEREWQEYLLSKWEIVWTTFEIFSPSWWRTWTAVTCLCHVIPTFNFRINVANAP
jgi:hypothetical protein